MNASAQEKKWLQQVIFFLYLLFFTSLTFSFHYFNSLSVGLLLILSLVKNKAEHKPLLNNNVKNLFLFSCILFYLFQFISVLYSENKAEAWVHLRIKSTLLFVPLALCCTDYSNAKTRKILTHYFLLCLFAASLYCLISNNWRYFQNGDPSVFFFHELTHPLSHHAVYFSIMIFIALVYLVEAWSKKDILYHISFHIFLVIFFSGFLFLLSSKLVIAFYIFYLLYFSVHLFLKSKKKSILSLVIISTCLLLLLSIFIISNPVSKRFKEVFQTDINLVKKQEFNPGIYFNDVQFRIVAWKLVTEILNERNNWWTGVGIGDGQAMLDKKYIEKNMYVGEPARDDRGFLGYNTHDQLLESLLQSGIFGALLFLLILFSMIRIAIQKKNRLLSFTVIILVTYSFFESVFETQYGILLFTFFPLFLSLDQDKNS